jgi:haloalkane dehalogenase
LNGLAGLADMHAYPYAVHRHGPSGASLAYIDEGPPLARPIVLLHSVPTWGYVFRQVIPWLVQAGHRVLVPDLLGCGRSDKPRDPSSHGLNAQLNSLSQWTHDLGLQDITLYGQGLGGLLAFRLALLQSDRVTRLALANTRSPLDPRGRSRMGALAAQWPVWSPLYPLKGVLRAACQTRLDASTLLAYTAPYSQRAQWAAVRRLSAWHQWDVRKEKNAEVTQAWLAMTLWHKPLMTLFASRDHLTRGGQQWFIDHVPGAKRQPHPLIHQAGHCLTEDKGPEVALALLQFIDRPQIKPITPQPL